MQSKAKQRSKKPRFIFNSISIACAILISTSGAYSTPAVLGTSCDLSTTDTSSAAFYYPNGTPINFLNSNTDQLYSGAVLGGGGLKYCFFPALPSAIDMKTTCDVTATETNKNLNYVALIDTSALPQPTYCLYQYHVDTDILIKGGSGDGRTDGALVAALALPSTVTPTAVPIFTPLGILTMLSGLLWFGKRRRKLK